MERSFPDEAMPAIMPRIDVKCVLEIVPLACGVVRTCANVNPRLGQRPPRKVFTQRFW
jgi:hypothetical protein